jgi:hypothetical protein
VIGAQLSTPDQLGGGTTGVVIGSQVALYGGSNPGRAPQHTMSTAWAVPRHRRPDVITSRLRSLAPLCSLIPPHNNVYYEWQPRVPWCTSQADFDGGHRMKFDLGGTPADIWYLYERWGDLRVFNSGYESGVNPPGFPMPGRDRMAIIIGPLRYQNTPNPRLDGLY